MIVLWGKDSIMKNRNYTVLTLVIALMTSCNSSNNLNVEANYLALGYRHTGVIDNHNRLWMFGYNIRGQIGNNQRAETSVLKPINITKNFNLSKGEVINNIALGYGNTIASTSSDRLFTWGSNDLGQIGDPNASSYGSNKPVDISAHFDLLPNETIAQLAISHHGAFTGDKKINHSTLGFVSSLGRLFVWGYWPLGSRSISFGTGRDLRTYKYFPKPTEVSHFFNLSDGEYFTKIDLGEDYAFSNHMAFLTNQGRLFMLGDNFYYQIIYLDADVRSYKQPVEVSSYLSLSPNETIIDVSLGNRTTSVKTNFDRVFLWGSNANGNLANNTAANFDYLNRAIVPIQFQSISAKRLEMAGENGFIISSNDYLYVWGDNRYHQLGSNSNSENSKYPLFHGSLGTINQFAGGNLHFGVIKTNGELWMWGRVGDGPSSKTDTIPQRYMLGK